MRLCNIDEHRREYCFHFSSLFSSILVNKWVFLFSPLFSEVDETKKYLPLMDTELNLSRFLAMPLRSEKHFQLLS